MTTLALPPAEGEYDLWYNAVMELMVDRLLADYESQQRAEGEDDPQVD